MSKIKDENYYQISGWMINQLELKGVQLNCYAIIYAFSQDGESEFSGSLSYLANFLGVSKPTIIKALKELVEKGYIIKNELNINNVIFNRYKISLPLVNFFNGGSKETLPPVKEFDRGGSKETLPNNKINNNKENNNIYIKEKDKKEIYFENQELNNLFHDYLDLRKKIKAVNSDRAINMLINELNKYEDEVKIKMIKNSIINSWKSVYPLTQKELMETEEQIRRKKEQEEIDNISIEKLLKELEDY